MNIKKNLSQEINFVYEESFLDSDELHIINKKMTELILNMRRLNYKIAKHERNLSEATVRYKRKYRESFFTAEGKNDSHKRMIAEIECEDLEAIMIYEEQMIKELIRMSQATRTELETCKSLGANIRQELNL